MSALEIIPARIEKFLSDTDNISGKAVDPLEQFSRIAEIVDDIEDDEEALWYLLLCSIFDSADTGLEFYDALSWQDVAGLNASALRDMIYNFFNLQKRYIGGHRKHFLCMNIESRVSYMAEMITLYISIIQEFGSQRAFWGLEDPDISFEIMYKRLGAMPGFHTRLFRYDYIERVSRTFDVYLVPKRLMTEGTSGPLDGLLRLLFGIDYGNMDRQCKKDFRDYIVSDVFFEQWNAFVNYLPNYSIIANDFASIIAVLERWLIGIISINYGLGSPILVYELESALCNWQKKNFNSLLISSMSHR